MSRIEEALRRASQTAGELVALEEPSPGEPPPTLGRSRVEMPDVDQYCSEREPAVERPSMSAPVAVPVLDEIRHAPIAAKRSASSVNEKLILSDAVPPVAIEQYRRLAATLHQVQIERGTKIVMVASATAGEGKTLTAANLALTLSESFRSSVLLIDADLRRPTVHELFQISNASGLNDGLKADEERKLSFVEVSPRLTVLPAGPPNPDPMSGLTSDRMKRIIQEASAKFEWVVLDTPPVGFLPDANLLAEMVDMVVFVVGAGTTPSHLIQRAVKAMDRSRIVGVVLNRVAESQAAYQHYHHYYAARAVSQV